MTETMVVGTEGQDLPVEEVLTGRGFLTGKSGAGKSNSGSVVAEELADRGLPFIVIDTDGEYWGLKESYEVLHAGVDEESDIQVGPEHAERLARLALEDRVPVILDVSGFLDLEEAGTLIREVLQEAWNLEKKRNQPFLILIEEMHEWLPQAPQHDDLGRLIKRIGKRGRKRGMGVLGLSQRPANVDKDYITQANWLVWHRLTWDNDLKVVRRVLGPDYTDPIQNLDDGECFFTADWGTGEPVRIHWRRKTTYDAGETPGLEDYDLDEPDLQGVSEDLIEDLQSISEEQDERRDRIEDLEAQVERLEEEKEELHEELDRQRDLRELADQLTTALQEGGDGDVGEKVEEIREEKNTRIRKLESRVTELEEQLENRVKDLRQAENRIRELQGLEEAKEELEAWEARRDEAEEAIHRLADALNVPTGEGVEERARDRVESLEARIEELEEENQALRARASTTEDLDLEYQDFLARDEVQAVIEEAKQESSPKYVKGILAAILDEGGVVSYDRVKEDMGISTTTHISAAATTLEQFGVIEKVETGEGLGVDLNTDGVKTIIQRRKRRERTESIMEDL